MSLIRPFGFDTDVERSFDSINRRFNQLFRNWEQQMIGGGPVTGAASSALTAPPTSTSLMEQVGFLPALDVVDEDKQITVHTDLPGLNKDDIKVEVQGQHLVISGESKSKRDYSDQQWKVRERSFGKFERRVLLPKSADVNQVRANYKDGVLEVQVGKHAEAQPQKKTITIQ